MSAKPLLSEITDEHARYLGAIMMVNPFCPLDDIAQVHDIRDDFDFEEIVRHSDNIILKGCTCLCWMGSVKIWFNGVYEIFDEELSQQPVLNNIEIVDFLRSHYTIPSPPKS